MVFRKLLLFLPLVFLFLPAESSAGEKSYIAIFKGNGGAARSEFFRDFTVPARKNPALSDALKSASYY